MPADEEPLRDLDPGLILDSPPEGDLVPDEIGEISPLVQLKLLCVLQEHEFERVGESRSRSSDVRELENAVEHAFVTCQSGEGA